MRHLVPLLAVLLAVAACTQEPPAELPERPPPPSPLSGGKPYVCVLLPKPAVNQATGHTQLTLEDESALGPGLGAAP